MLLFSCTTVLDLRHVVCCRELASNLSPDLIRDFDERWWQAAKKV
jgi:hypothetical protein